MPERLHQFFESNQSVLGLPEVRLESGGEVVITAPGKALVTVSFDGRMFHYDPAEIPPGDAECIEMNVESAVLSFSWLRSLCRDYGGVQLGKYRLYCSHQTLILEVRPDGDALRLYTPGVWLKDEAGDDYVLNFIRLRPDGRTTLNYARSPDESQDTEP